MFRSTAMTIMAQSIGMILTAFYDAETGVVSFRTLTGYEPVDWSPIGETFSGQGAIIHAAKNDGTAMLRGSTMAVGTVARLIAREDHIRHGNAIGMTLTDVFAHPHLGKVPFTFQQVVDSYTVEEAEQVA